jgi:hypothetical protein
MEQPIACRGSLRLFKQRQFNVAIYSRQAKHFRYRRIGITSHTHPSVLIQHILAYLMGWPALNYGKIPHILLKI